MDWPDFLHQTREASGKEAIVSFASWDGAAVPPPRTPVYVSPIRPGTNRVRSRSPTGFLPFPLFFPLLDPTLNIP
eukprot:scaffold574_cov333-Pavlova_lutheri.AAC.47